MHSFNVNGTKCDENNIIARVRLTGKMTCTLFRRQQDKFDLKPVNYSETKPSEKLGVYWSDTQGSKVSGKSNIISLLRYLN